ncbi:NTP transferase domain-containing protein [Kocuria sp.]|uniref:nucleotidyltransferase family protein n=1 Tax=Kocuria sp. TaxID=1871328 RepID=UPI002811608C|nr:NTP transferase domain-containing protein [Kocuria sp.]
MTALPSPPRDQPGCAGLLLAAGAGRRLGTPKALLRGPDGRARVQVVVDQLRRAGCEPVHVVVGAAPTEVAALVTGAVIVPAPDWAEGLGASLRAGLRSLEPTAADAVLIMLVDLPGVGEAAMRRVLAAGTASGNPAATAKVRAHWRREPGHPVLLGRAHWPAALGAAHGDRGARALLSGSGTTGVECSDLGDGHDVDVPQDAVRARLRPPEALPPDEDRP